MVKCQFSLPGIDTCEFNRVGRSMRRPVIAFNPRYRQIHQGQCTAGKDYLENTYNKDR